MNTPNANNIQSEEHNKSNTVTEDGATRIEEASCVLHSSSFDILVNIPNDGTGSVIFHGVKL